MKRHMIIKSVLGKNDDNMFFTRCGLMFRDIPTNKDFSLCKNCIKLS